MTANTTPTDIGFLAKLLETSKALEQFRRHLGDTLESADALAQLLDDRIQDCAGIPPDGATNVHADGEDFSRDDWTGTILEFGAGRIPLEQAIHELLQGGRDWGAKCP